MRDEQRLPDDLKVVEEPRQLVRSLPDEHADGRELERLGIDHRHRRH